MFDPHVSVPQILSAAFWRETEDRGGLKMKVRKIQGSVQGSDDFFRLFVWVVFMPVTSSQTKPLYHVNGECLAGS